MFLAVTMSLTALLLWLGNKNEDAWTPLGIGCMVLLIVGSFLVARTSRSSLKDSLAIASMFMGAYIVLNAAVGLMSENDRVFVFYLCMFMAGGAVIFFGCGLFAVVNYNIIRIRCLSAVVLGAALIYLVTNLVTIEDIVLWAQSFWIYFILIAQVSAFLVVSLDR